MTKHYNY